MYIMVLSFCRFQYFLQVSRKLSFFSNYLLPDRYLSHNISPYHFQIIYIPRKRDLTIPRIVLVVLGIQLWVIQYWSFLSWRKMWFRCGSCKLKFTVISQWFAIFKKVVHILEPGEMQSYSASHQAPNNVQPS